MIFFDTTKTGRQRRRSGLHRVSECLRTSLFDTVKEVAWDGGLRDAETGKRILPEPTDAFLTSELFSEPERPGFTEFITSRPCRTAAIFHDAIPLRHPHITWPQSVARHAGYIKLLACFDRIWAVSHASRADLAGFWNWQGVTRSPPVDVLALGADFNSKPRIAPESRRAQPALDGQARPQFLCVGIIEPRKNQSFLLDVCADLWAESLEFDLHLVGRLNPHFGHVTLRKLKSLRRAWGRFLHFHPAAPDHTVARLHGFARATLFPSIAEGCGLPLLESLWMGVPCICSDLPVLRENADGGGCLPVPVNDRNAWKHAMRSVITDAALHARLEREACSRPLPTWRAAAATLAKSLAN